MVLACLGTTYEYICGCDEMEIGQSQEEKETKKTLLEKGTKEYYPALSGHTGSTLATSDRPLSCSRGGFTHTTVLWVFTPTLRGWYHHLHFTAKKTEAQGSEVLCQRSQRSVTPPRYLWFISGSFFLNWSVFDLQCHVQFCCTAKWFSYA